MADEIKDQRIITLMTPSEVEAIDEWMFSNRIKSRGEAIRRLCQIGMAASNDTNVLGDRLIEILELAARLRGKVERIRDDKDREIITKRVDAFAAEFVLWARDVLQVGVKVREYSTGASFEEASAAVSEMLTDFAAISFADAEAIKRDAPKED